jgi:phytoene dehydrogenase-like protein
VKSSRGKHIVVAGAGLGGLSAALRLAQDGHKVTVVDQRPGPGGKAFEQKIGPYRFDTGPSLFTMKEVFADLFRYIGEDIDQHLKLVPIKKSLCHYFWDDGERLEMPGTIEGAAQALSQKGWTKPSAVEAFFRHGQELQKRPVTFFFSKTSIKKVFLPNPAYGGKCSALCRLTPCAP